MVRAILEGRKTQTRRVVKPQPNNDLFFEKERQTYICKYGRPGDRLYVRETWREKGHNFPIGYKYEYRATCEQDVTPCYWKWKPSIHMPRVASRLLLEITEIRVEQLHDISEENAKAEGIQQWPDGNYKAYGKYAGKYKAAKDSFFSLWQSINGGASLVANPWVWVISFKQIEQ